MTKKTYKAIAIIALVVSIIGLVSFAGGIKPVNIGAVVFPLFVSAIFFWLYKKQDQFRLYRGPIGICGRKMKIWMQMNYGDNFKKKKI